jgi:biopolymer transport protein ExbD
MAFQPSKSKKNLIKEEGGLNMNSMMDMMTIILLFLLKSFSTEGALVTPSETLRLPTSVQTGKPQKMVGVSISKDFILVNDQVVVPDINQLSQDEMLIQPLAAKLREYAAQEKELEAEVGKPFKNQINIQGDEHVPFDILYKVMLTCSKSEFYNMRLVTIKKS